MNAQVGSEDFEQAYGEALELLNEGDQETLQDAEYIYQILGDYYRNPINLNACTARELQDFILLNPIQKRKLLEYRKSYGAFINWQDVLRVDGISQREVKLLQLFATLEETAVVGKSNLRTAIADANKTATVSFRRDLRDKPGFAPNSNNETPYAGSPWRTYGRFRITKARKFSAALLFDKDPGETFLTNGNPEFLTGHVFVEGGNGWLKSWVVGDFQFRAGQDLTVGPSFAFSKSSDIATIHRTGRKIRPSTSVSENLFYRGAAATFGKNGWELSLAASFAPRDARIDSLGNVRSFPISGLHRTASEIAVRNQSKTHSYLAALEKQFNRLTIGTAFASHQRHHKDGQELNVPHSSLIGLYYEWTLNRGLVFGEINRHLVNQKTAVVQGGLFSLHPKLNFGALYRYLPDNWNNLSGLPFTGYGRGNNEQGIYTGFEYFVNKRWITNIYIDQQTNLGPDTRSTARTLDRDFFFQLKYYRKRNITVYGRIRHRIDPTEYTATESERFAQLQNQYRTNLRLHTDMRVSKEWSLRYRIEWLLNEADFDGLQTGRLFYQDLVYKPKELPFDAVMRIAWFDTDSYNERVYAYENDLLYTFSIPPYAGKGMRYYAKVRYNISYKLTAWIRYANWVYQDRNTISSGNNRIEGNSDPEIALMVRFKI